MPKITVYDADGNPFEIDEPESPNVRQMREHIATLEEKAKRADDLELEISTLKRTSALRDAGLTFDETKMSALQAVHQGEWTPDAVRETAIKLGWAEPVEQTPEAERLALERLEAARTGGTQVPPNADAALDAKLANAKNAAEVMQIYRDSGRPIVP